MRCIDCLCFWAPRNTTSTAPGRPLALGPFLFGAIAAHLCCRAGRSPNWIKVKNRKHPAMSRVADSFA